MTLNYNIVLNQYNKREQSKSNYKIYLDILIGWSFVQMSSCGPQIIY